MEKTVKKLMAFLLASALAASGTNSVWASQKDIFTDGAVFDAEEMAVSEPDSRDIPGILPYALPDGKEGREYSYQIKTETVIEDYELTPREGTVLDLGVIPEGERETGYLWLKNSGLKQLHLKELPESEYFNIGWTSTDWENEVNPGSEFQFYARVKENLPAGHYEEKFRGSTEEGVECEITVKVVIGSDSEEDYALRINPETVEFPFSYFTYPQKDYKVFTVTNIGQKETTLSMDASGLEHFTLSERSVLDEERVWKQGETDYFYVKPSVTKGRFEEKIVFSTSDGSEFPIMIKMDSYPDILTMDVEPRYMEFGELVQGYEKVPSQTLTIKNTYKEEVAVSVSHDGWVEVGELSRETLQPGETAQMEVRPVLGLEPTEYYNSIIYFTVKSVNGKTFRFEGDVHFRVREAPKAPSIKTASVKYCDLKLTLDTARNAEGYDVVLARKINGAKPEDYAVVKKGMNGSSGELILYNVPKGTYYAAVHSYYRDKTGKKVLSGWSNVKKVTITKKPAQKAPVIKNVKVSGRNVTLTVARAGGTHGSNWVLAKKCVRDGKDYIPKQYAYTIQGGTNTKIVFKNVKPGAYYISGRGYLSAYKRHYTKWAPLQKITVK